MLRTFNCGVGMVVVVDANEADAVSAALQQVGENVIALGQIEAGGDKSVAFDGKLDLGA